MTGLLVLNAADGMMLSIGLYQINVVKRPGTFEPGLFILRCCIGWGL
jgi:hypothetical protein